MHISEVIYDQYLNKLYEVNMVKWKKYLAAAMVLFLLAGHTSPFFKLAEAAEQGYWAAGRREGDARR